MRRLAYILLTLALVACGTDSSHFKIEGRFLHLNQGEFYVYSIDGLIEGIDTIRVNGGRFSHEMPCKKKGTLILLFPNFSEQAVFAEPGKVADIKADASHLKEMEVKGSEDNELMTRFRKEISDAAPPEVIKKAEEYISDNPESMVSIYLLRKFFVQTNTPDYEKGYALITTLEKKQPRNNAIIKVRNELETLKSSAIGNKTPAFSAYDIDGKTVSNADIRGKVTVITAWASWSYDSQSLQRKIKELKKKYTDKLTVISVCLDASKRNCRETMKRDSITWANICDGQMFESPVMKKIGLTSVPDNIVVGSDGKIVAHSLSMSELEEKLVKMLK